MGKFKYIIAFASALALCLALAGCGGSSASSSAAGSSSSEGASSSAAAESSSSASSSESSSSAASSTSAAASNAIVIANDDVVTIEIGEGSGGSAYYSYDMSITNNADTEIQINSVADSFTVNGTAIAPTVLETVAPGETVEAKLSFSYNDDLPDKKAFDGATVTGEFSVYNSADTSIKLGSYPFTI